jgi:subtilisin family serine protease
MRLRTLPVVAAVGIAAAAVLTAPSYAVSAAGAPPGRVAASPQAAGSMYQVTLVTGDQVRATPRADGSWDLAVRPADRDTPVAFAQSQVRHGAAVDWYLLPADAAGLVSAGVLDRELFNITGLIRQGYDDARSPSVPLLVQYADAPTASRAPAAAGTQVARSLPRLGIRVLAEHKATAAGYWRQLTGTTGEAGRTARPSLPGGQRRIWLDAAVHASLDRSVPLIGAPAAWRSGLTGKGVTVAVLDTGYDASHPDLTGRVGPTRDFTGSGTVDDQNGHGTHVASIIAGSGAASGGRYRGVAPDATLAIGKVLDQFGGGQLDDVLAGMEWAAADVHAKVVNLSLGGGPSDGTDLASQALNALTARYGTLFVVAAGNSGSDDSVDSPASADAALAVASTTKTDELSDFSSRGPRLTDGAAKPEIAAPGTDIVAARGHDSELGEVVDQRYQRLSGTSMATPHVAGAAAILVQQHPDWTAEQLRSGLVGSATPVDAGTFAVGSGRLDVARATSQSVTASPATISSYLKFPSTAPQERQIAYRNTGTTPVTLALSLRMSAQDGTAAPAALTRLSASSLTVPAGRQAAVTVAASRSGQPAKYGGVLVASTADGSTRVRTPVAIYDEPERYDLDLRVLNRDGATPAGTDQDGATLRVTNMDTGDDFFSGPGTLRLPPGRYAVVGLVTTPRPGQNPTFTMFADPVLRLGHDTTLTFDARKAQRTAISTDQPAARGGSWASVFLVRVRTVDFPFGFSVVLDPRFDELFTYSLPGVSSPDFALVQRMTLVEPALEVFANRPRFELVAGWFEDSQVPLTRRGIPVVVGGQGRPVDLAGLDLRGKLTLLGLPGETTLDEVLNRIANVKRAGGDLVAAYVLAAPAGSSPPAAGTLGGAAGTERGGLPVADDDPPAQPLPALPTLRLHGAQAERFAERAAAGGLTVDITTRAASRYRYELAFPMLGAASDRPLVRRVRTAELAAVPTTYHAVPGQEIAPTSSGMFHVFDSTVDAGVWQETMVSGRRVEYFTPGTWDVAMSGVTSLTADNRRLRRGRNGPLSWSAAVIGPCFTGGTTDQDGPRPWARRAGDTIDAVIPAFCDGSGHPGVADEFAGDTGSTNLYQGGTLIGASDRPAAGTFEVPAAPTTYRLATDVRRDQPWWPLSTVVHAEWTFRSGNAPPAGTALPLLSVRAAAPVDLLDTAAGGRTVHFPVSVSRQDTRRPRVTALRAEVSYDDGQTWQAVRVDRVGGSNTWVATVHHPGSGYASLRLAAADSIGDTVTETIVRAYRIG